MKVRRRYSEGEGGDALLAVFGTGRPAPRPARVYPMGRVNLHPRGFGFVTTEAGEAFYIAAEHARALLAGDVITFLPAPQAADSLDKEIKAVVSIQRQEQLLLGELAVDAKGVFLRADEPCFLRLQVALSASEVARLDKQVVAVSVPAYAGQPLVRPLDVVLARELGQRDQPGFTQSYALIKHGFHAPLPAAVQAEAEVLVAAAADDSLLDLTALPLVTIDGESTRDFDDAVHATPRPDGGWTVSVAIADVSWYVQPGSALDTWAAERCTTVYLPGRTTPMLPEALSNGLCSLTPGDVRRAVVVRMSVSAAGVVGNIQVDRAWIRSAGRLLYGDVAEFMAGQGKRYGGDVEANLQALTQVYKVLSDLRSERGRLDFDEPEPSLRAQPDGSWQLVWESRTEAHKLVEELMLLANRVIAELVLKRYGVGLLRHQPPPDAEDWRQLRSWALTQAHDLPEQPCIRALAGLLREQPDADRQAAASYRIRSAMRPARYVFQPIEVGGGHFSLSFEWYTHFTSPIRRYADLLVHRLLLAPAAHLSPSERSELAARVARCSDRAYAARLAERSVWDSLKQQIFLAETKPDQRLRARVVRITSRGVRVVLQGSQCSAWLTSQDLKRNGYRFDAARWVSAERKGDLAVLQEGYTLPVKWARVVLDRPAYPELQVALSFEEPL